MLGKRCESSQATLFTQPYAQIKYKAGSNQTSKTALFQDLKSCDLTVVRVQVPPRVLRFSITSFRFLLFTHLTRCDLGFICDGVTRNVGGFASCRLALLSKFGAKTVVELPESTFPHDRLLANRR